MNKLKELCWLKNGANERIDAVVVFLGISKEWITKMGYKRGVGGAKVVIQWITRENINGFSG